MKIVTVVGARPQFIKAATVSRAIARHNASANDDSLITEVMLHTGQHFHAAMSDVFFSEMELPKPDYFLDINSLSHGAMTGRMLEKIETVLQEERPDFVIVYGDTNSTLAGALAAKKLGINVLHVEAGLRSFTLQTPEEINRVLTDRISDILCCPTATAVLNLEHEGYANAVTTLPGSRKPVVVNTGDVMLDAALHYGAISGEKSDVIRRLQLGCGDFALCTIHRAENTDDPLRLTQIFQALREISNEMKVVLPLHPRTLKILNSSGGLAQFALYPSLALIEPVGYFDMVELLKHTRIVLTDSGGLQKEAYFFKKPCVTLRDETEWVELLDTGTTILAGAATFDILAAYRTLLTMEPAFRSDLYGNGAAAANIIKQLLMF